MKNILNDSPYHMYKNILKTNTKKAVLAGGCFWGMEELLRNIKGITDTEVGYTGGKTDNPTWQNHGNHAEAIELTYDASIISYEKVLDHFFRIHNPTTLNQQGNDKGSSYRSAIFFKDGHEKGIAQKMIARVNDSKKWANPVTTTLEPLGVFYAAEEYHQDYLQKTPGGYTCHVVYNDGYLN